MGHLGRRWTCAVSRPYVVSMTGIIRWKLMELRPDLGIFYVDFLVLSCISALSRCSLSSTYLGLEFLAKFLDTVFPSGTGDLGWLDLADVIDQIFRCGGYHSVVVPLINKKGVVLSRNC